MITRQHQEFNYYCLDRLKPLSEEIPITYNDGNIIRKILYKVGLRTNIKHQDCFVLYTESDADLDSFVYIAADNFYDYQQRFFNDIFSLSEVKEIIKTLTTINIFEYTSLLDFTYIYTDFKDLLEFNWSTLDMDNLIEL